MVVVVMAVATEDDALHWGDRLQRATDWALATTLGSNRTRLSASGGKSIGWPAVVGTDPLTATSFFSGAQDV